MGRQTLKHNPAAIACYDVEDLELWPVSDVMYSPGAVVTEEVLLCRGQISSQALELPHGCDYGSMMSSSPIFTERERKMGRGVEKERERFTLIWCSCHSPFPVMDPWGRLLQPAHGHITTLLLILMLFWREDARYRRARTVAVGGSSPPPRPQRQEIIGVRLMLCESKWFGGVAGSGRGSGGNGSCGTGRAASNLAG